MCLIVHAIHCYQTLISTSSFNRPEHNNGNVAACTARDACHACFDTVVLSITCQFYACSPSPAGGSTTEATVMLYDDLGGPLSNLTKTGPNQVTLSVGHTYSYKGPPVACSDKYTVSAPSP